VSTHDQELIVRDGVTWMRGPVLAGIAAAGVAAVVGVGLVVLDENGSTPQTPARSTGSATPGRTSAPTTAPAVSPFTGLPAPSGRPVLAVKIDNVRPARPQTGLDRADIVYVEPVEGGLSRIMAIFSSRLPARVGPVRSARESDLELLAQYGRPGLVYSGANRSVQSKIRKAPVVDLSQGRMPGAYRRSSSKAAPHNLFVDPRVPAERGKGIGAAKDIGFRFGALPAGVGSPTTRKAVRYGAARTAFSWSAKRKRWDVTLDGRAATTTDGGRLGAGTAVIQYTKITSSAQRDVLGNSTPYTRTVGVGTALVLRDGLAVEARWSRPTADAGTSFTTTTGAPLPFAAGQVWVVFAAAGP
jgi:DUF3048 family protein